MQWIAFSAPLTPVNSCQVEQDKVEDARKVHHPGRMKLPGYMKTSEQAGDVSTDEQGDHSDALSRENRALKARIAELERLVACDTLTPLYNRRHFMDVLDRWCWRAHRYGGNYGLLFIDVDNLKAINDRHGHVVGDLMLQAVAKTLLASIRRSDLAARIGGDEFAVLLDNIPAAELAGKAERIEKAIGKQTFHHDGAKLGTGISVGYTMLEPGVKPTELIARADRAMYEAKQAKFSLE